MISHDDAVGQSIHEIDRQSRPPKRDWAREAVLEILSLNNPEFADENKPRSVDDDAAVIRKHAREVARPIADILESGQYFPVSDEIIDRFIAAFKETPC